MRDLATSMAAIAAFGPTVLAADTLSSAIDLQGFDAANILLSIGIGGITFDTNNKIEFVGTHSDDGSTYTNMAATDFAGPNAPATVTNGIFKSLTAAHAAVEEFLVGYIGNKRYIKILADFSGTHGTGTPLACTVLKGRPRKAP